MKDVCKRAILRVTTDSGTENRVVASKGYGDVVFSRPLVTKSGWSNVKRSSSDEQGQVSAASGGVSINDDSGWFRDLIKEDPRRFFRETEASLEVISEATRKATDGADWRYLLRGKVQETSPRTEYQTPIRRRSIDFRILDALAPYYDRKIPNVPFMRSDFPNIHRDIENTMIPLIGGEHSFPNATDVSGNPVSPGMVPAIHVGKIYTVDDVPHMGTPVDTEPAYLVPPVIDYSINGTPGTRTIFAAVTKLSAVGETTVSNVLQIEDAPSVLNETDSIELTWDDDPDATGFVVYLGDFGAKGRVAVLAAGSTSYTYTGVPLPGAPGPPDENTAQTPSPDGGFFWDLFIIGLGRNLRFTKIYASDVGKFAAPKRVAEDAWMTNGVDFLTPDSPAWPLDDPWITLPSGIEVCGFFGRGPRAQHHIDGVVTIAVDTCGYIGENDEPIKQAGPMLKLFLNEFVLKNNGEPYRSGDWGPLEAYSDGVTKLHSDFIDDWQDLTKLFLDDEVGYLAHIYLREAITVRTFLQLFLQTFGCKWATDHNGRGYVWDYNPFEDETTGQLLRERIEVARVAAAVPDRTHVEPIIRFQFRYNPDTDKYESEIEEARHPEILDIDLEEIRSRGVVLARCSRDAATVRDAQRRKAKRLGVPRWRQGITVKFQPGLELEPGMRVRLTHQDGGWTEHPFTIVDHEVDMRSDEVILTTYDTMPILQAEDSAEMPTEMPFVME